LSLQQTNNRFENIYIVYLPILNSIAKKKRTIPRQKNTAGVFAVLCIPSYVYECIMWQGRTEFVAMK
jgi:hypothetical protein